MYSVSQSVNQSVSQSVSQSVRLEPALFLCFLPYPAKIDRGKAAAAAAAQGIPRAAAAQP